VVAGLVVGVVVFFAVALADEALGTTAASGVFALVLSALLLGGVIDPAWAWAPQNLIAQFPAQAVVPVVANFSGLLTAWSAAKARGEFGTRGREAGAYMLIGLNAAIMITVLLTLIGFVVSKGLGPVMTNFSYTFPLTIDWPLIMNPSQGLGIQPGVKPAILGTLYLVVGAVVFSLPLSIGAAVFLTEYAEKGKFTRAIEVTTNGLWSTPSVVYGLFGLAFLVPRFGDERSILAGQLVLGFMLMPLVLITSREAIKSVPDGYRDASAALGVSKWQTIRSVVLPAAMPGVITGMILGVGRIAGETAPILLVASGATFPRAAPDVIGGFQFVSSPPFITNPALLEAGSALPYQLYALITAGVGTNIEAYGTITAFGWGTALVLLVVVLSLYAIGIVARLYFRRKLKHL
jgi:phosphate transport system permease protein